MHGTTVMTSQDINRSLARIAHEIIERNKTAENLMPVWIDRDQVRQALDNLITNAVDAMPNSGRLTISAGREEIHDVNYMFLKVTDTGSGVPSKNIPLIFEPFFSTKNIGHGTGLGLSITRKIMEEHGGFLKVERDLLHPVFPVPKRGGISSGEMLGIHEMRKGQGLLHEMPCLPQFRQDLLGSRRHLLRRQNPGDVRTEIRRLQKMRVLSEDEKKGSRLKCRK